MSRGIRNNNPGNIRCSATIYQGEKRPSTDKSFKQFCNMAYGYRAMFMLLYTYQKRYGLHTLRQMIARYAPPNENNTDLYIETVATWADVEPDLSIQTTSRDVMVPLVAAMSRMENGVPAVMSDVETDWKLFEDSIA